MFYQSIKHRKSVFYCFVRVKSISWRKWRSLSRVLHCEQLGNNCFLFVSCLFPVIKHNRHLRTLKKCRKHSPVAHVFYISLMFSNACRVLSQCNTRLWLFYLLIMLCYGGPLHLHKVMCTPTYRLELWVFCDKIYGVIKQFFFNWYIFNVFWMIL